MHHGWNQYFTDYLLIWIPVITCDSYNLLKWLYSINCAVNLQVIEWQFKWMLFLLRGGGGWSRCIGPWRSLKRVCARVCVCVCKQMRPLEAGRAHCSSSSYTPLSDSTAPHSLEDGGLRSTIRWGTLVLCLQLPDRELRQPGKSPASAEPRDFGLCRAGCVFARRRLWRTLRPVEARLSAGLQAASPRLTATRYTGVCVCVRVRASSSGLTCGFHVLWRNCHPRGAMRNRRIKARWSRCRTRGAAGAPPPPLRGRRTWYSQRRSGNFWRILEGSFSCRCRRRGHVVLPGTRGLLPGTVCWRPRV